MSQIPNDPSDIADRPASGREPSPGAQTAACFLSGAIVGGVAGALVGLLAGGAAEGVALGGVIGVILGLIAGRRIAACPSVLGGAAFGAFLPLGLLLIHLLRSGRITEVKPEDLASPPFLIVLGVACGSGAVLGAALVGLRKLFARLFTGGPSR
jgi:hypothetical protein